MISPLVACEVRCNAALANNVLVGADKVAISAKIAVRSMK
jgi:hypothetical protein